LKQDKRHSRTERKPTIVVTADLIIIIIHHGGPKTAQKTSQDAHAIARESNLFGLSGKETNLGFLDCGTAWGTSRFWHNRCLLLFGMLGFPSSIGSAY
jgi:hypothetical protein